MISSAQLDIACNVGIEIRRHGRLIETRRSKNLVVVTGRNIVRDLIMNVGPAPNCIAVGKGQSATTPGMTALENEFFRNYFTRKIASASNARFQLLLAESEANSSPDSLGEAGIFVGPVFNGAALTAGGILFARTHFTPIVKDNTISLTFTWDVTIKSV